MRGSARAHAAPAASDRGRDAGRARQRRDTGDNCPALQFEFNESSTLGIGSVKALNDNNLLGCQAVSASENAS